MKKSTKGQMYLVKDSRHMNTPVHTCTENHHLSSYNVRKSISAERRKNLIKDDINGLTVALVFKN